MADMDPLKTRRISWAGVADSSLAAILWRDDVLASRSNASPTTRSRGNVGLLGLHIRAQYIVHTSLVAPAGCLKKRQYVGIDAQGDLPFVRLGYQRTGSLPGNSIGSGDVREVDILVR